MLRPDKRLRMIASFIFLLALLFLTPLATSAQSSQPVETPSAGATYIVQPGDSWLTVSTRTGIPIAVLREANPQAIHPNLWLWMSDRLFIPAANPAASPGVTPEPTAQPPAGHWYRVQPGDTWVSVSQATGVPVLDLWRANPSRLHPNRWLYIGQWLLIPAPGSALPAAEAAEPGAATAMPAPTEAQVLGAATAMPAPTASATASPTATPAPTASATASPTAMPTLTASVTASPTAMPTLTASATPSPTATPLPTATETPTPAPSPTLAPQAVQLPCPANFVGYPDAIATFLKEAGGTSEALATWLRNCGVTGHELSGVSQVNLQGGGAKDLAVILMNPKASGDNPVGLLLVYHKRTAGYVQVYKAEGVGPMALLAAEDLNADGKPDLAFTDFVCDPKPCTTTLFIESWDGMGYRDWIDGDISATEGGYTFEDVESSGSGKEILAHSNPIAAAGAGPQRGRVETYISPKGGPYKLFKTADAPSDCLYFRILDANAAFNNWAKQGFDPAIAGYQQAIGNTSLKTCGTKANELATLRDFARYRLVVSLVAGGYAARAPAIRDQITTQAIKGAADTFLKSYKDLGSIVQACRDTTRYAQVNPGSWNALADWGTANPTFSAKELCPLG